MFRNLKILYNTENCVTASTPLHFIEHSPISTSCHANDQPECYFYTCFIEMPL